MKKIKILVAGFFASALLFGTLTSCDQLLDMLENASSGIDKPSLDFKDVSFKNLDSEGITLECQYDITNPYAINLNVDAVKVDVACEENAMGSIDASEGISMEAKSTKTNKFDWKIKYDSLLNLANSYKEAGEEKDKLPFTFSGKVALNNELLPDLEIPFSKNVNAPVVKPSFEASSPKLNWPSSDEIIESFKRAFSSSNRGILDDLTVAANAANFAYKLTQGEVDVETLKKMDLNLNLNFNLDVSNKGGAAWAYLLKTCSIDTKGVLDTNADSLIEIDTSNLKTITSASGTIPLTAKLNTVTAGDFIASIVKGSGTNPTFKLGSDVKFPGLGGLLGDLEIPLDYELGIPLSSISSSFGE
ncbi:MAG: LEA type 2 family protein [Treponema sp.]|nr:LEA type 2 family protein [Candidatus Treponema equifaecale]